MFDVGFWEMAFIGVIALVVIGPERLPGVARTVGLWIGKARRMINEVKKDVNREMKDYDMDQVKAFKADLDEASQNLKDVTKSTTESFGIKQAAEDLKKSVDGVSETLNQGASDINQAVKKNPEGKKVVTKKSTKKKASSKKPVAKKVVKKAVVQSNSSKPAAKSTTKRKVASKKKTAKKPVIKKPSTSKVTPKSAAKKPKAIKSPAQKN